LSEPDEITNLKKEIASAKMNKSIGIVCIIIGIVSVYLVISFSEAFSSLLLLAFMLGLYFIVNGSYQYDKLMEEIYKMTQIIPNPPCLNCEKEFPTGNSTFCPFCEKSLKVLNLTHPK
jgi:uncharacterized membrane protein